MEAKYGFYLRPIIAIFTIIDYQRFIHQWNDIVDGSF